MNLAAQRLSLFGPTELVHSSAAGLNGGEPETAISTSPARFQWAISENAGLIDPAGLGLSGTYRIIRLQVFGDTDTVTVNLIDGNKTLLLVSSANLPYMSEGLGFITSGQKLKITSGSNTTSLKMVITLADALAWSPAPK
jgi:hypothetical protein